MESSETNQIMEQLYISYAVQKYLDSVKRSRTDIVRVQTEAHSKHLDRFIDKGIDD